MITVDACGLSCPEPVIRLKNAVGTNSELQLLVDNQTAVENCTRFAKSQGFVVDVRQSGDVYTLVMKKG